MERHFRESPGRSLKTFPLEKFFPYKISSVSWPCIHDTDVNSCKGEAGMGKCRVWSRRVSSVASSSEVENEMHWTSFWSIFILHVCITAGRPSYTDRLICIYLASLQMLHVILLIKFKKILKKSICTSEHKLKDRVSTGHQNPWELDLAVQESLWVLLEVTY